MKNFENVIFITGSFYYFPVRFFAGYFSRAENT